MVHFNTNDGYGISVVWADDYVIKKWQQYQIRPFNPIAFRKYSNSILTGEEASDSVVLKDFENNIKRLEISGDKINGYSISFTSHTKYQDIVTLIDICNQHTSKGISFLLYNDEILLWKGDPFKLPPPPPKLNLLSV